MILVVSNHSLDAQNKQVVRVGIYNNYPKVFIDNKGKAAGIFPETINLIASKENWQIEYVPGTWNEGLQRLKNGEIDIMVDVALSDEREEMYDFNMESVLVSWGCIYSRIGKDINTIIDLEGKTIAVMKNSILTDGEEGIKNLTKRYGVECDFIEVDDYYQVFDLIQQGKADAGLTNRQFGAAFQDEYNVKKTNFIFYPTQLRLAFTKDSKQNEYLISSIDENLKKLKDDPNSAYYSVLANYKLYPKKGIPSWIIPFIIITFSFIIFLLVVYLIMKWRIKQKTHALKNTNEVLKKEIADHLRTMKELELSRENYKSFVENIPGLVYMYDVDETGNRTPILKTNRNEEFLGKELAQKVDEDYNSFFDYIVDEDKQRIQKVSDVIERTGQVFDNEYRVRIIKDHTTWFRSIGRVKKLLDGKLRWQGVMLDINQRKEAEAGLEKAARRWQSTFDSSNDAIWILDMDQNILQANKASEKIFGVTPDNLIDTYCYKNSHETDKPIPDCPFIKMKKSLKREYMELQLDNGNWLMVTVDPIFDKSYKLIGAVHNVRDITGRKKIEHELDLYRGQLEELVETRTRDLEEKTVQLEKANIELKEADRLKSIFLASMSHELRTPLNSIIGFTGILLMGMVGELTDEQKRQLKIVKESANHLLELINDILDISKIEAGKVELHEELVDIDEVIQEVVDSFEHKALEKGLVIEKDVSENIQQYTDRRRFKQVIINLMGNAVKFTDEGKVSINAEITDDNVIEITVQDTGIGIKKEDMKKLFEPFQQIDSSLTKKHEGTGLGLHLTLRIMNLLNGQIKVESTAGEGTIFSLYFPHIIKD